MADLTALADRIDRITGAVGGAMAWLAVLMVLVQFAAVLGRHAFGISSILIQDSVLYLHSFLFLSGAAYTLLVDGHIRVDLFYRNWSARRKAIVNLVGMLLLVFPFCGILLVYAIPYAARSWSILEGAQELAGLHLVYVLKTGIVLFALFIALQSLSAVVRAIETLRGIDA